MGRPASGREHLNIQESIIDHQSPIHSLLIIYSQLQCDNGKKTYSTRKIYIPNGEGGIKACSWLGWCCFFLRVNNKQATSSNWPSSCSILHIPFAWPGRHSLLCASNPFYGQHTIVYQGTARAGFRPIPHHNRGRTVTQVGRLLSGSEAKWVLFRFSLTVLPLAPYSLQVDYVWTEEAESEGRPVTWFQLVFAD